jgi:hypothetical protein
MGEIGLSQHGKRGPHFPPGPSALKMRALHGVLSSSLLLSGDTAASPPHIHHLLEVDKGWWVPSLTPSHALGNFMRLGSFCLTVKQLPRNSWVREFMLLESVTQNIPACSRLPILFCRNSGSTFWPLRLASLFSAPHSPFCHPAWACHLWWVLSWLCACGATPWEFHLSSFPGFGAGIEKIAGFYLPCLTRSPANWKQWVSQMSVDRQTAKK